MWGDLSDSENGTVVDAKQGGRNIYETADLLFPNKSGFAEPEMVWKKKTSGDFPVWKRPADVRRQR